MTLFEFLKTLHVCCALLSVAGFALRGYWVLEANPLRSAWLVRVLPHVVDTLLLGSAVGMLVIWNVSPLALSWVSAKIIALLVYIGLGLVVMRFAKTRRGQAMAYAAALCTAAYIISVALTHSALGPLVLLGG